MRQKQIYADASLLFVAIIWGSTFIMVKDAVMGYPVFSYLAMRFAMATITMLPVWWFISRQPGLLAADGRQEGWPALAAGVVIGVVLMIGYAFQTVGLRYTTAAKAGFITGMSVILVPVIGALFLHQRATMRVWLGVALAIVGLALLTLNVDNGLRPNLGDVLVFGCAVAFAVQILSVAYMVQRFDALPLTVGQLVAVTVLSALVVPLAGEGWPRPSGSVLFSAAFTGIFASALAFSVQTIAQRFTEAVHTALIFSAEPVFAALFSFLLAGERFTVRVVMGSVLILTGMLVVELGPYLLHRYREVGWSWLIHG